MTKQLKKEIENIISSQGINCPVEKFIQKANWFSLSLCQPLSIEFIEYFEAKINWDSFFRNKKISDNIKQQFIHKL